MNTSDYDNRMEVILNSGEYVPLNKNPTSKIERKVYRCVVKCKQFIPAKTRTQLTSHFSKVPHMYGVPKIHKENIPLRPVVSS